MLANGLKRLTVNVTGLLGGHVCQVTIVQTFFSGAPLIDLDRNGMVLPLAENLRRLRDPTKPPSPKNGELSHWAASAIEPLCWASDQEPRESIGKL
ncbi:hypothetical protein F7725_019670 [Dissostichus mawsoni]|uniref:Uncharacterized protein n=1 Tax=Dissostichus mawsoni TaxID=36200 RepID=A0A7J5YLS8_DISMA|nr:hypothetical protein F7725_019670 [Dissostichus mawsoni]